MITERKLILNMMDLDHIIGEINMENKNEPPSLLFLEQLVNETNMNGVDLTEIDVIEINID